MGPAVLLQDLDLCILMLDVTLLCSLVSVVYLLEVHYAAASAPAFLFLTQD